MKNPGNRVEPVDSQEVHGVLTKVQGVLQEVQDALPVVLEE
jgi:hypothetical protein